MATPSSNKKGTPKIFMFGKENYYLMFAGLVLIIIGFMLMAGGRSEDPNVYSKDIFSFRRITLAPIVVILGFIVEIVAIMRKPKTNIKD
ncbi:DUF3098 domain-containing protein [Taibaiella sp. KBW10]|uniref:DUF3098 domain-containing protein n=1 Tax=Taibaiella sp. KBW10 TaxID=2153357 RepID=UPI000F5A55A5|nr:DUF3098 domain-containing protein [Taibaiella sp. KBW10]RQO29973.1 DUF3098 domain-containing protein [Taibaiella sp. KBW10]